MRLTALPAGALVVAIWLVAGTRNAGAQVVIALREAYAINTYTDLPGGFGLALSGFTASKKVGWGVEVGYSTLGDDRMQVNTVADSSVRKRSSQMWYVGPQVTVRLADTRWPPRLYAGLAAYSFIQSSQVFEYQGGVIVGASDDFTLLDRTGIGLNLGGSINLLRLSRRVALQAVGRVDLVYTTVSESAQNAGPNPDVHQLYPIFSLSIAFHWRTQ